MPNWSYNSLSVYGNNKKVIEFYNENSNITEKNSNNHLDFYKLVPIPKDKENDWYNWNCQNLGTKWNIHESELKKESRVNNQKLLILRKILNKNLDCDVNFYIEIMKDYYTTDTYIYNFDTAWSPPYQWLFTVAEKYPSLTFKIEYDIEGYDESGIVIVQNEDVIHSDKFSTSTRLFEENKEDIVNFINDFIKDKDNKELLVENIDELNDEISDELVHEYATYFESDIIKNLIIEIINKKN